MPQSMGGGGWSCMPGPASAAATGLSSGHTTEVSVTLLDSPWTGGSVRGRTPGSPGALQPGVGLCGTWTLAPMVSSLGQWCPGLSLLQRLDSQPVWAPGGQARPPASSADLTGACPVWLWGSPARLPGGAFGNVTFLSSWLANLFLQNRHSQLGKDQSKAGGGWRAGGRGGIRRALSEEVLCSGNRPRTNISAEAANVRGQRKRDAE